MLPYLMSLAVGFAVGVIYGVLSVRSPAPPVIALVGLFGILGGEAAVSYVRGHGNVAATLPHGKSAVPDAQAAPPQPDKAHAP